MLLHVIKDPIGLHSEQNWEEKKFNQLPGLIILIIFHIRGKKYVKLEKKMTNLRFSQSLCIFFFSSCMIIKVFKKLFCFF
jgi:hypothetical protein